MGCGVRRRCGRLLSPLLLFLTLLPRTYPSLPLIESLYLPFCHIVLSNYSSKRWTGAHKGSGRGASHLLRSCSFPPPPPSSPSSPASSIVSNFVFDLLQHPLFWRCSPAIHAGSLVGDSCTSSVQRLLPLAQWKRCQCRHFTISAMADIGVGLHSRAAVSKSGAIQHLHGHALFGTRHLYPPAQYRLSASLESHLYEPLRIGEHHHE